MPGTNDIVINDDMNHIKRSNNIIQSIENKLSIIYKRWYNALRINDPTINEATHYILQKLLPPR